MPFIVRCLAGGLTVAVLALAAGCTFTSGPVGASAGHAKGVADAKAAIAAGTLKLKEYPPLPSPAWQGEYVKLLKERCGVGYEVPGLPPGVAEADFIQEVRGWNETMQAAIEQKCGNGILAQLHEEAQKRWQEHVRPGDKK
jgi:hypothetical protein